VDERDCRQKTVWPAAQGGALARVRTPWVAARAYAASRVKQIGLAAQEVNPVVALRASE